jgi:hypothetical protein
MFAGIFRSWWGSLVMLIAILIVLERAGGVSRILGSLGTFTSTTVKSFR